MNVRSPFEMIPEGVKIVAVLVSAALVAFFHWLLDEPGSIGYGTFIGLGAGILMAGTILLTGYVYADAQRRAMPALAWAALSLLVPNGIGFLIYFLLRKPLLHPCPRCTNGVPPDAAFCPRCGQAQAAGMA